MKILFLTISDAEYFPGTVASTNAIRHFHPQAEIVVVNNRVGKEGLQDAQIDFLRANGLRVLDAEQFALAGRKLAAWELKAYVAAALNRYYDVLIGIDSDCLPCAPFDDVIALAADGGKWVGAQAISKPYDHTYRDYGFPVPAINDHVICSALYFCGLSSLNRLVLDLWAEYSSKSFFVGGHNYCGHGDEGVLNALLWKHISSTDIHVMENRLWAGICCYWDDDVIWHNQTLWNRRCQQAQRALHPAGELNFWEPRYREALEKHPSHRLHYAWFLLLLHLGQGQEILKDPGKYLHPSSHHLGEDALAFAEEIEALTPALDTRS